MDFFKQIDEFKEKAAKLQSLITSKESKVNELQQLLDEREDKARELDGLLIEKQKKADGIIGDVREAVGSAIGRLDTKFDELKASVDAAFDEQRASFNSVVDEQKESINHAFEDQNVKLSESIDKLSQTADTLTENFGDQIKDLEPNIFAYIDENVMDVHDKFDGLKNDVFDKIHDESVKNYRNTQANIKELGAKLEQVEEIESRVRGLKGLLGVTFTFSLITLAGMIVLILDKFGVINTFFG